VDKFLQAGREEEIMVWDPFTDESRAMAPPNLVFWLRE
jgi:hypothetical protein